MHSTAPLSLCHDDQSGRGGFSPCALSLPFAPRAIIQLRSPPMSAEQNRALIRRLFEELVNNGNIDVAGDVFADNVVDHGSPPERQGLAGVKDSFSKMRAAFPDLHCTLDDVLAEGERVHVRLTIRGTHRGAYAGIPPTGASI